MRSLRAWLVRALDLFAGRKEREFADELTTHLELHVDDNLRAGMAPDEARRHAFASLGGRGPIIEGYRDRAGLPVVEAVVQDFRYAVRTMYRAPGFTIVSLLTLALGVGATTALFSVVDAVVLQPLAYQDAERLVVIHEIIPSLGRSGGPMAPVNALHFREWQNASRAFEEMSLVGAMSVNLAGTGDPERLQAARVSSNLFAMLGVKPRLGRSFFEEEDQTGRDSVVILNDALWRRRFSADPGVIGRAITVDGQPHEVVGVMPPDFRFPKLSQLYDMPMAPENVGQPQLWKPFAATAQEMTLAGSFNFVCIARLRADIARDKALADLNVIQAALGEQIPGQPELRAALVPLHDQITSRSRRGLALMLGAVFFVLLIGCVNIANLLLVRSAGRRRELAIRAAIGASRGRVFKQLLVENFLLSGVGGLVGVAVAYVGLHLIVAYAPADVPRLDEVDLNGRMLAFAAVLSVATGVLVGVLPARRSAGARSATTALRTTQAGQHSGRLRFVLVGGEVALSTVCLIVAGLLLNSFVRLLQVDPGFETQHIETAQFSLPTGRYRNSNARGEFVRSALERLQALPGVLSVGVSNNLPLTGTGANGALALEGTNVPRLERPVADLRLVNAEYFRTMGIPVRAGRLFDDHDRGRMVAIVSSVTADRLWPGQDPVGKRFRRGPDDSPYTEVVGVVGAIRTTGLDQAPPTTVYLPYWSFFGTDVTFAIKSASASAVTSLAVRNVIRGIDSELAVPTLRGMDDIVAASVAARRFQMTIVAGFAGVALLLACLGIYGVASHAVTQRTNEFGIRLCLGARSGHIRRLVVRQGLVPIGCGLGAGAMASIGLSRVLDNQLFGVAPTDPLTIAAALLLMGMLATFAIDRPARRAAQVDPLSALRAE